MSLPEHVLEHAEVVGHSSDREAWLKRRVAGIGASEVAAVLGISPYSSPLNVYAAKRGITEDAEPTERMRWGSRLEATILHGLAEERGRHEWHEIDGRLLRSKAHPFMLATPDGWLVPRPEGEPLMVEVKNSDRGEKWDEVPAHVWCQAQAQMLVTGEARVLVAVLIRGNDLRQFPVERDPGFINDMVEACRIFWHRVEAGEPPPPDGSEATARALRRLYPEDSGEVVALPAEVHPLADERAELVAKIKAQESRQEEIDNTIKAAMKTAAKALLPDGSGFRWHTEQRRASACPACAHVLTEAKTIRKFVPFKAPKKKEG